MGQQQLLLIVLGVIIVGIAIVVGINLFNANAISSNRDAIISDLNNLGAQAQQYYQKPTSMGGGGGAFDATNGATAAWAIPSTLVTTANAGYALTSGAQSITLVGTSTTQKKGTDGSTAVKVTAVVTPGNIAITINN